MIGQEELRTRCDWPWLFGANFCSGSPKKLGTVAKSAHAPCTTAGMVKVKQVLNWFEFAHVLIKIREHAKNKNSNIFCKLGCPISNLSLRGDKITFSLRCKFNSEGPEPARRI